MKRPERALVLLKPQYIGDAVMACPLIDAATTNFENVCVSCGPLVQEVLRDRANRVTFLKGRKISGILPILRTVRQLRNEKINAAFVVNRSFRSALAVRLAGIPIRIGHATEGRNRLLTHLVDYETERPEVESQLDLIRELGLPGFDPRPRLRVEPQELAENRWRVKGMEIGVQPGARYPEKQVPLIVFAEVVNELLAQDREVVLLGGEDEKPFAKSFETMLSRPVENLVGKLKIRETMVAVKELKLVLGSDTGLMHVAAAVGCPTVTVFGPNPAKKWAHDYPPHRFIAAQKGQIRLVTAESILEQTAKILT